MSKTAYGINENMSCLVGRKFIDILHHWLQVKSVFKAMGCSFQLILH